MDIIYPLFEKLRKQLPAGWGNMYIMPFVLQGWGEAQNITGNAAGVKMISDVEYIHMLAQNLKRKAQNQNSKLKIF